MTILMQSLIATTLLTVGFVSAGLLTLIGALLFIPFVQPFPRLLPKLLPEKPNELTAHLDRSIDSIPLLASNCTDESLRSAKGR